MFSKILIYSKIITELKYTIIKTVERKVYILIFSAKLVGWLAKIIETIIYIIYIYMISGLQYNIIII